MCILNKVITQCPSLLESSELPPHLWLAEREHSPMSPTPSLHGLFLPIIPNSSHVPLPEFSPSVVSQYRQGRATEHSKMGLGDEIASDGKTGLCQFLPYHCSAPGTASGALDQVTMGSLSVLIGHFGGQHWRQGQIGHPHARIWKWIIILHHAWKSIQMDWRLTQKISELKAP